MEPQQHDASHARVDDADDAARVTAWESLILAAHVLDAALERQAQRDGGISHGQFKILVLLAGTPRVTLGLKDVADILRYSLSRLSHALGTLERQGLVVRYPVVGGRRAQEATLTPEGRKLVTKVLRSQRSALRDPVLGSLSDEDVATLTRLSNHVIEHVDTD
ncbi:hypothetical protein HH310_09815 [Actinoplanes sp. TBRC 11911]|uniref:MarR family winged helix-turn-helix transcriptional regulator n=1 Tax=Actinoplanes sp. TBRC 11911 TaxID=2729386 RepID=UPI00145FD0E7|nr:MarR family transcriptional regulator [Actinoplanes sp. TBRC 11911]NMO51485.1 hypothetical protein [Actinoplanes sp. TBRC 11911]